jgi:hypothetical protein
MKRVAFEIELEDDDARIDAATIVDALSASRFADQASSINAVRMLQEPSPQTYHPERRWLAPS